MSDPTLRDVHHYLTFHYELCAFCQGTITPNNQHIIEMVRNQVEDRSPNDNSIFPYRSHPVPDEKVSFAAQQIVFHEKCFLEACGDVYKFW
jgi:hypothetical protein